MTSCMLGSALSVAVAPGLLPQFMAQAGALGGLESPTMRLGIHTHDDHPGKQTQPPPTGRQCSNSVQQAKIAQAGHPVILIRTRTPQASVWP